MRSLKNIFYSKRSIPNIWVASRIRSLLRRYWLYVALVLGYTVLYIPFQIGGADNPEILLAFSGDEHAQYGALERITTWRGSIWETFKSALIYDHYYYGYPFYVVSAIAVLPLRALSVLGSEVGMQWEILVLRQLSPLFFVTAIVILVSNWKTRHTKWLALFAVVFIGAAPAVFRNNMLWHPDSQTFFFLALSLVALNRDDGKYSKWFWLSAVFAGLSAGTKLVGFFVFLPIIAILIYDWWRSDGLKPRTLFHHGVDYALVMVIAVVISNPLLLHPTYRTQIIDTLKWQIQRNASGWLEKQATGFLPWYNDIFAVGFGVWSLLLLAIASGVIALIWSGRYRRLNIILLSWSVGYLVILSLTVGRKVWSYAVPGGSILLLLLVWPLLLLLVSGWLPNLQARTKRTAAFIGSLVLAVLVVFQFTIYLKEDSEIYGRQLEINREHPALLFYEEIKENVPEIFEDIEHMRVYRDPKVYFPSLGVYDVRSASGPAVHSRVYDHDPDVIILFESYVNIYRNPEFAQTAVDEKLATAAFDFYVEAYSDSLEGYSRVYRTRFGSVYTRTDNR